MGRFVKGEWIYVLGKIAEIDPHDSTRYRVDTNLAKFYVTEAKDTLRSNPADVYTASELYGMFLDINKMTTEDIKICFGNDFSDIRDVFDAEFSITEIREMFLDWQFGNSVNIGDMVYYTAEGQHDPVVTLLCSVIDILEGEEEGTMTDNVYTIYSDELDQTFVVKRAEIASARKRSKKIIQSLSDLKEATKEAREAIG